MLHWLYHYQKDLNLKKEQQLLTNISVFLIKTKAFLQVKMEAVPEIQSVGIPDYVDLGAYEFSPLRNFLLGTKVIHP